MALVPPGVQLTDDQSMLLETVRAFAREELLPLDRKWDTDESSVAEVLPRLGEMGFLSVCMPEHLNGLGASYQTYAAMIHELAYASPSTAVTVSVHSMVGNVLNHYAAEPARTQWVSGWGDPANFASFAVSEADAGSNAAAVRTTAEIVEGGFLVNGEKMWITNGMTARWFLALVRIKGGEHHNKLCAMVLDGNRSGLERTKIQGKMGIRGSETAVIHLNNAFVPNDHRIGPIGDGLKVCLYTLNEGRVGIASQACGIAEACLDEMISYARQRKQFGQPIGKFQAVSNMIADSAMELAASRELIWKAAGMVHAKVRLHSESSMAKLYATEAANRIAYRAVQVHGGTGYVHECRVEQLYRDARVTTIYEGTSEIQRVVIGRELRNQN